MSSGARSTRRKTGRWRRTKNSVQWFKTLSQGPILSALPLILILFVTCLDFITLEYAVNDPSSFLSLRAVANEESVAARLRADAMQKNVQAIAYVLALFLLVPQTGKIVRFFLYERGLSLIILAVLLTAFVSDYATKVYTNTIHIGFGLIAAFLFAYPIRRRRDMISRVLWVVFIPSGIVLLVSLLNWLYNYYDYIEAFENGFRYGGFVGNPNNLGWVCMLLFWSGLGLSTNRELKRGRRIIAFVGALLAVVSSILADSKTTHVVLVVIAVFALWDFFITSFNRKIQNVLKAVCILALIISTPIFIAYILGPGSAIETASETLTGDATLTGRSDIWEVGRAAFLERPILGWSFDTHLTVFDSQYAIPYTQYHNGYIDTLVSGGLTLLIAVLLQIAMTSWRTFRLAKQDIFVFPVYSFLAIVFVANISEYALIRIDNPIWQTYVICATAIAIIHFSRKETVAIASKPRASAGVKRRKSRYRF